MFVLRGHSNNTWHSKGGGWQSVTDTFYCFFDTVFNDFLKSKWLVWKQDKALKYTFCILHFAVQSILGIKMTDNEMKNVTREGKVRKEAKKCHIFIWMATYYPLEWDRHPHMICKFWREVKPEVLSACSSHLRNTSKRNLRSFFTFKNTGFPRYSSFRNANPKFAVKKAIFDWKIVILDHFCQFWSKKCFKSHYFLNFNI